MKKLVQKAQDTLRRVGELWDDISRAESTEDLEHDAWQAYSAVKVLVEKLEGKK